MFTLLLTLLLAFIIIVGIIALCLIFFGLGWMAIITLKISIAVGLIYMGIKILKSIFGIK